MGACEEFRDTGKLSDSTVEKLEIMRMKNDFSQNGDHDKQLDKLKEKEVCRALLMKERRNQEKWAKKEKEEEDKLNEEYQKRREERDKEDERRRAEKRRRREKERDREKEKDRERRKRREELQAVYEKQRQEAWERRKRELEAQKQVEEEQRKKNEEEEVERRVKDRLEKPIVKMVDENLDINKKEIETELLKKVKMARLRMDKELKG